MRAKLTTLIALAALGAGHAHASDTLTCSGDLSFVEGTSTRISCAGDLWLGGGLTLVAEESISVRADLDLEVSDAYIFAPSVLLEAGNHITFGGVISSPGGSVQLALSSRGTSSLDQTSVEILHGATINVAANGPRDGVAIDPSRVVSGESGLVTVAPGGIVSLFNGNAIQMDGNAIRVAGSLSVTGEGILSLSGGAGNIQVISIVPEPEQYALFLAGLGLLATRLRRRA